MKIIKDNELILNTKVKELDILDSFNFKCHKDIECYNMCCKNINIFLNPYDILRLKNKLNISSDEFLDKYTDVILREGNFFPDVLMKMKETDQSCPFLNNEGCSIYNTRPDACRYLPIEQGIKYDTSGSKSFIYFYKPPDFCCGINENENWTIKSWLEDQGVNMTNLTMSWGEFKAYFIDDPWGIEGPYGKKGKMAFMAIYNIDVFKDFLINSSFLKRFKIKKTIIQKIKLDEKFLIKFAFDWVKYYLWGISSKHF